MLTEIRDRSSGWFAWVIAALIIIPMAFWGVQEYATVEANPSLIEFGDQKITKADFDARLNSEQQRVRQQMGDNINEDFLSSDSFKQSVLQRLVNSAVIEQVAIDQNYRVSDAQLAQQIKQSQLFQLDGKFNQEAYDRFLVTSQYSKTRYEDLLRKDVVVQQVTNGYQESAIVLPDEVRTLLEVQAERRSFDVATLRKEPFVALAEVSDAQVEEYYSANTASFMEPEKMSVEYLELNIAELAEGIEVSEEELEEVYQQNAEAYMSSAKRATRHILLSTTGDEDASAQLAKAEQLVSELRAGADFAELAKAHSQDTGSAQLGGSLGMVERGQMVAEFEEATFALEKDAISDPVKSQFGYHIIQVTDIQTPEQQSFADVRFDLLQEERERKAQDLLIEKTEQLRDLVFEQPDNLDTAAEELGLELRSTDLFSRTAGDGIASSTAVRNVAFSEEVMIEELNSEPIEVSDEQLVVVRKKDVQAAAPMALADVRTQIISLLSEEKARAAAAARGEELLIQAKSDWANINDQENLEYASHTVSLIDQNRAVSPELLQKVSTLQLTAAGPEIVSVVDRNGDFHIVRLRKVEAGDISKISEQIKDSTRRVLAQRNGQALVSTYIESLKQSYAPTVNNEML